VLSVLFDRGTTPDISYVDALRNYWTPICAVADIKPMSGIQRLSDLPRKQVIHPLEYWSIRLVSTDEVITSHPIVDDCLTKAEQLGIPFAWYLYIEQHITPPQIVVLKPETVYETEEVVRYYIPKPEPKPYDPALIGLIQAGEDIGVPFFIGYWLHK